MSAGVVREMEAVKAVADAWPARREACTAQATAAAEAAAVSTPGESTHGPVAAASTASDNAASSVATLAWLSSFNMEGKVLQQLISLKPRVAAATGSGIFSGRANLLLIKALGEEGALPAAQWSQEQVLGLHCCHKQHQGCAFHTDEIDLRKHHFHQHNHQAKVRVVHLCVCTIKAAQLLCACLPALANTLLLCCPAASGISVILSQLLAKLPEDAPESPAACAAVLAEARSTVVALQQLLEAAALTLADALLER